MTRNSARCSPTARVGCNPERIMLTEVGIDPGIATPAGLYADAPPERLNQCDLTEATIMAVESETTQIRR